MYNLPVIVAIKKNKYPKNVDRKFQIILNNSKNIQSEIKNILPNVELTTLSYLYNDALLTFSTDESLERFPQFRHKFFESTHVICFFESIQDKYLQELHNTHDFYSLGLTSDDEIQWLAHHYPFNPFESRLFNSKPCTAKQLQSFFDSIKFLSPPLPKNYQWFLFHREQVKIEQHEELHSKGTPLLYSMRNPLDNSTPSELRFENDLFSDQLTRDLNNREIFSLAAAEKSIYFKKIQALDSRAYVQGDLTAASDISALLHMLMNQQSPPTIQFKGRFAYLTQSEQLGGFCYIFDTELKQLVIGALVQYDANATSFHHASIGIFIPSTENDPSNIEILNREWLMGSSLHEAELKYEIQRFVNNPEAYQRIEACIEHPELYTSEDLGEFIGIEEIQEYLKIKI